VIQGGGRACSQPKNVERHATGLGYICDISNMPNIEVTFVIRGLQMTHVYICELCGANHAFMPIVIYITATMTTIISKGLGERCTPEVSIGRAQSASCGEEGLARGGRCSSGLGAAIEGLHTDGFPETRPGAGPEVRTMSPPSKLPAID
jgi:hypothetical protein